MPEVLASGVLKSAIRRDIFLRNSQYESGICIHRRPKLAAAELVVCIQRESPVNPDDVKRFGISVANHRRHTHTSECQ